jgi:hypothetical protein
VNDKKDGGGFADRRRRKTEASMSVYPIRPAMERSVDDLAALAREINSEHAAGEESARKGLSHFRQAGIALIKAKDKCGHGKWLDWLKANVRISRSQATRYMKVAREWAKCCGAATFEDALKLLTDDVADEQEPPPDREPGDDSEFDHGSPYHVAPEQEGDGPEETQPVSTSKPADAVDEKPQPAPPSQPEPADTGGPADVDQKPQPAPAKKGGSAATSEPAPVGPPTDKIGIELKPDQWPAFDGLDLIGRLVKQLKECNRMVHSVCTQPGGEELRRNCKLSDKTGTDRFSCHDITNAIRLIEQSAPYAGVCPYCHDAHPGRRDLNCKGCGGLPYVRQGVFERAPEEMQAKVMALAKKSEEKKNEAA